MDEITKLQQELMIAKSMGIGLSAVFSTLFFEHAKKLGGTDAAVAETRAIADKSLASLTVKGPARGGKPVDAGPDMRRRIAILIDQAERYARKELALPPTSKSSH